MDPTAFPGDILADTPVEEGLGLCTTQEVQDFYADCLGPSSTGAACGAALETACGSCIVGAGGENFPAFVVDSQSNAFVTRACEAIAQGKPFCAQSATAAFMCQIYVCDPCTGSAFDECIVEALETTGPCDFTVPMCDSVALEDSPACLGSTFQQLYTKSANAVCGAGLP